MKRSAWAAPAWGLLLLLAGCGLAGNPQPPTLWLPQPVRDLTATRVGNDVQLHWMMPRHTTDKVTLKGDQQAHICWVDGAAPAPRPVPAQPVPSTGLAHCTGAGDGAFAPNRPATFTAQMPPDLRNGAPRVVSWFVELRNSAGKTAGPSNPAWVATGAAPAAVEDLHLETRSEGVALHWQPAATEPGLVLRIHRTLVENPAAAKPNESSGNPPPVHQTLEVDLGKQDPGQALDADAVLDHTWRYTVERVLRLPLQGHDLEIAGLSSPPVSIDAKDIFAPAVPTGLAVLVDEQAHSLDLSWSPDTDADLAGYVVYRRDITGGTSAERISGTSLVVPPSFDDKTVVPGHRYAYAVSAVDRDGNESARSPEAEEELPQ